MVTKSLLGKIVSYTLDQWPRLVAYLDVGYATPDNNLAENAIRSFVVGRKNWLFAGTLEGATASVALNSLIETAKANGLCLRPTVCRIRAGVSKIASSAVNRL